MPKSDFLLSSLFSRSPTEIADQLKYSPSANAVSLRAEPGGPTKKILRAIKKLLEFPNFDSVISHMSEFLLTLRLLKLLNQEIIRILWLSYDEFLEQTLHELKNLFLLEV